MNTRQFLTEHIDRLQMQIAAHNGALEFAQFMLLQIDEQALPIKDSTEMVADASAPAIVENGRENE